MSEESDLPEPTEPEGSEPERKFRQEHYDRLMKGQKPWLEFLGDWEGEDDPWEAFMKTNPGKAATVLNSIRNWNTDRPQPAWLESAELSYTHLDGARLETAHLEGARLVGAYLGGASLVQTHLEKAHLEGARLVGAQLRDANLSGADLREANLSGAQLGNAVLFGTDLRKAVLLGARLEGAALEVTNLEEADLGGANLEGASLTGAYLEGTNLSGARVRNTVWTQTCISNTTKLSPLYFSPDHFSLNDGSESIVLENRDRKLNWGTIRRLGSLPLFGVSYAALSVALLTITGIGFLNETRVVDWLEYPVPLPNRVLWLLLSSAALAFGSTLYRWNCPDRVQTFSETEWVEAHGRPRLLFIGEKIKRPWQWSTSVLLWLGAVTGGALLLERVIVALIYIVRDLPGLG